MWLVDLARGCAAVRGQPGNDVGHVLIGHGMGTHLICAWHALVWLSGDKDATQSLIADQRKVGRIDKRSSGWL
jgi:hypothetical protein